MGMIWYKSWSNSDVVAGTHGGTSSLGVQYTIAIRPSLYIKLSILKKGTI